MLHLRDDQNVQIQAMEETTICNAKLTANITIPSRSLAAVTVKMILPTCRNKTQFNFVPTTAETLLGPNCVIYPLDYATIKGGPQRGFQVVVNLSCQEIQLSEGMILRQFQQMPDEEIKVTQEDLFGINATEPWTRDELEEEVLKGDGRGFITSPR